eukprot:scaffold35468_cov237-Amphora_coffeaeformis.AAC.3
MPPELNASERKEPPTHTEIVELLSPWARMTMYSRERFTRYADFDLCFSASHVAFTLWEYFGISGDANDYYW